MFFNFIHSSVNANANVGASVRWALAAALYKTLRYELQLLPVRARLLNKQNLRQDNVLSVLLLDIPVKMDLFDDPLVAGPVPHLFAPNKETCEKLLDCRDLSGLLDDIRAINRRILAMEHVSLLEAVAYMQGRERSASVRGVR